MLREFTRWHARLREYMTANDWDARELARRLREAARDSSTEVGRLLRPQKRDPVQTVRHWLEDGAHPMYPMQRLVAIVTKDFVKPDDLKEAP